MGSPTSDDDPTRRVGGPGGWGRPGQGGQQYPGPPSPPPGQGGQPGRDSPTTRFPQPEEQRGQTAQFPQVGGYPPGGPGGPYPPQGPYGYGGPPGGPPPGGDRSRKGLIAALIAGVVVLAGVGVALVIAFTRDDSRTESGGASTSTTTAATSSSPEPSPTDSSSAAPSSPTGTSDDPTDQLLAAVPVDFTDCAGSDPAGDGDIAAVDCGASTTRPGPTAASFYLYEDTATLDQVFADDAAEIPDMPEGADCTTAEGVTVWNPEGSDDEGGEVACTITAEGVLLAWTDREFGIEGVVTAPGSTQGELAELAEWWRLNSAFQR
jgi:hypothetical protein